MTNNQKKDLARLLFVSGACTHQGELATRVDVSQVTLSKWKIDGKWEDQRKSLMTTRQDQLRNLYNQLAALNDAINKREEGQRYPVSKEADVLAKVTAAIRNLETDLSLAQVVDVFIKFNEHVERLDLSKAKDLVELQDSYIKTFL